MPENHTIKLFIGLLLLGISASALAAPPPTGPAPVSQPPIGQPPIGQPPIGQPPASEAQAGEVVVLTCKLKHSVPRDAHHPPRPFSQHFHVDMQAKTVDGVRATVSADKIGWEPVQTYLRPYATLSLPAWHFNASRHLGGGHVDEITGSCKPQG